ncbi:MAG: hypothetical protein JSW35_06910 [Deltaproteobacteria bacterium]|nr:MAG: hypothetical protein JSW35_06910 [Deltaproteobacteria bacterium]
MEQALLVEAVLEREAVWEEGVVVEGWGVPELVLAQQGSVYAPRVELPLLIRQGYPAIKWNAQTAVPQW